MRRSVESAAADRAVITGIRPEDLTKAALVDDATRARGCVLTVLVDELESRGSDAYAHCALEGSEIDSEMLADVAELGEFGPMEMGGPVGDLVARLPASTTASSGANLDLWVTRTRSTSSTRRPA